MKHFLFLVSILPNVFVTNMFLNNNFTVYNDFFFPPMQERGDEKGSILVSEMLAVEPVEDGLLTGQKHAFQVTCFSYFY